MVKSPVNVAATPVIFWTVISGLPESPAAVPVMLSLAVINPAPLVNWLLFVGIVGVLVKLS